MGIRWTKSNIRLGVRCLLIFALMCRDEKDQTSTLIAGHLEIEIQHCNVNLNQINTWVMKSQKSEPYRRPPCPHKNQSPTKRMSGFCFMLKDKFFNLIEARLVKIVNPPGEVSQSTRICLDSVARTYSNIFVHFYDLDRQNLVIN